MGNKSPYELVFQTPNDENYFFRYFNKKQLSSNNLNLLALKIPSYLIEDISSIRCDLHSGWSIVGTHLSIDTMNDGCRSIYVYRQKNK